MRMMIMSAAMGLAVVSTARTEPVLLDTTELAGITAGEMLSGPVNVNSSATGQTLLALSSAGVANKQRILTIIRSALESGRLSDADISRLQQGSGLQLNVGGREFVISGQESAELRRSLSTTATASGSSTTSSSSRSSGSSQSGTASATALSTVTTTNGGAAQTVTNTLTRTR